MSVFTFTEFIIIVFPRLVGAVLCSLLLALIVNKVPYLNRTIGSRLSGDRIKESEVKTLIIPDIDHHQMVEISFASSYSKIEWKTYTINQTSIYYPTWDCPLIWHGFDYLHLIRNEILQSLNNVKDKRIVIGAVTEDALLFLNTMRRELKGRQIDFFYVNDRDKKTFPIGEFQSTHFVLFDIAVNTGQAMVHAENLVAANYGDPNQRMVIFYNDLIPYQELEYSYKSLDYRSKVKSFYRASIVLMGGWGRNEALLNAIEVLKDLHYHEPNNVTWNDVLFRNASRTLAAYVSENSRIQGHVPVRG